MPDVRIAQLESCNKDMFGDMIISCQTPIEGSLPTEAILAVPYMVKVKRQPITKVIQVSGQNEKEKVRTLLNELLSDINRSANSGTTDYNSTSGKSHRSMWQDLGNLESKDLEDLRLTASSLRCYVERIGSVQLRLLKRRDALLCQQDAFCDVITQRLLTSHRVPQQSGASQMRFSIQPAPGDTGFTQWVTAMKMVAQLPGGIPPEFRRRLWLQLAERHLQSSGVNWPEVERTCLTEWQNPGDGELGVQIVKDLHRTGCSLFCGEGGRHNQALLKRVLLAYARWNKAVGYCQGFNMLAALMLQVTDRCESDALKLMIYLIEGVLPDSYFADSLRGLSVDMAVFRELLRSRLPALSKHLDKLQTAAKDGGRRYEPPLTNVFTMQWFLTLFCNCLPHMTVLRVWDLILLEGNEILLRTALAIWQVLAEKIMTVRSADEFYCVMGVLTREILESGLIDSNSLIKAIVSFGSLTELKTLREHYTYNINPWGSSGLSHVVDKQVKVYPRPLALDITVLKKQYDRLRQRQREARVILGAVAGTTSSTQPCPARPALNHLLVGRPALGPPAKDRPKAPGGTVPPPRVLEQRPIQKVGKRIPKGGTLHWKDAPQEKKKSSGVAETKIHEETPQSPNSTSSSDTELCDESEPSSADEEDNIDNLAKDSNEVTNDNISAVVTDRDPDESNVIEPTNNVAVIDLDVEENNDPEFEQFLADRVKSLRVDDQEGEETISYSRRNSERAFQIMQENSVILHRILQCQNRMSPSPPSLTDLNLESHEPDVKYEELETRSAEDLQFPVYGSKYSSILEKSKSLDEKYNTLILNKPSCDKDIPTQSSSLQEDLYKKIYCESVAESDEKDIKLDFMHLGCYSDSKSYNINSSDEQQSKDTLVTDTSAQLENLYSLNSSKISFSLSDAIAKPLNSDNYETNTTTEDVEKSQNIRRLGRNEVNEPDGSSKSITQFTVSPNDAPRPVIDNFKTNNVTGDNKINKFGICATNSNLLDRDGIESITFRENIKDSSNISEKSLEKIDGYDEENIFLNENGKSSLDISGPSHSEAISITFDEYSHKHSIFEKDTSIDMRDYQKAEDLIKVTPQTMQSKPTIDKSEYLLDDGGLSNFRISTEEAIKSIDEEFNLSDNKYFAGTTAEDKSLQEMLDQNTRCKTPSRSDQELSSDSTASRVKLPCFTSKFRNRALQIDESPTSIAKETLSPSRDIEGLEKTRKNENIFLDAYINNEGIIFDSTPLPLKSDLGNLSKDINHLIQSNKSILPEVSSSTYSDKPPSTHEAFLYNLTKFKNFEQCHDLQDKKSDAEIRNNHLSEHLLSTARNFPAANDEKCPLNLESYISKYDIFTNKDQTSSDGQSKIVFNDSSMAPEQLDTRISERENLVTTTCSLKTIFPNGSNTNVYNPEKTDLVTYKFPVNLNETAKNFEHQGEEQTKTESETSQTTNFPRYEAYIKKIAAAQYSKANSCIIESKVEATDKTIISVSNENIEKALATTANKCEDFPSESINIVDYLRKLSPENKVSKDKTSDQDSAISLCPTWTSSTPSISDSSYSNCSINTSENVDTETQSELK